MKLLMILTFITTSCASRKTLNKNESDFRKHHDVSSFERVETNESVVFYPKDYFGKKDFNQKDFDLSNKNSKGVTYATRKIASKDKYIKKENDQFSSYQKIETTITSGNAILIE